ncbi:hypothetical protein [Marinicauda pacifica]|uniref:Uncharacterized protein n=1 Tax=Marinicauda pacifica TaxID=1133559 RepID=A0A4S2H7U5_9PROT|nr:hypothetical protein [Marinicauda pacifica]TGY91733.1 hypothetical protein E5162_14055 [Marinicauda pacifica]
MTPAKLEKLRAMLAAFPGDASNRLAETARHADPALARLIEYCSTDPEVSARKRFFAPLAPLSHDPETTRPSLAYAPPAILEALWHWIDETLDPEAAEQSRAVAADVFKDEAGRLDEARVRVAGRILDAVAAVKDEPREAKRLKARLGVRDFDSVRDIAVILRAAPALRTALEGLPEQIGEISDTLSADLRDRYETAAEADPDAGAWFLYFVMARLTRPWRILRAFERIGKRGDDFLLSRTDMSGIGEALLLDAGHFLAGFAQSPKTEAEADAATQALSNFAAITVGMTREIGIRKDGPWGQKLVELRNRASSQMERHHERTRKAFEPLIAAPKSERAARMTQVPQPGSEAFTEAQSLARFLLATKDDAARAAAGGAHQQLLTGLQGRLEELGGHLLNQLRVKDQDLQDKAQTRLEAVALLMTSLGEGKAAAVLLRRGAAAKAA